MEVVLLVAVVLAVAGFAAAEGLAAVIFAAVALAAVVLAVAGWQRYSSPRSSSRRSPWPRLSWPWRVSSGTLRRGRLRGGRLGRGCPGRGGFGSGTLAAVFAAAVRRGRLGRGCPGRGGSAAALFAAVVFAVVALAAGLGGGRLRGTRASGPRSSCGFGSAALVRGSGIFERAVTRSLSVESDFAQPIRHLSIGRAPASLPRFVSGPKPDTPKGRLPRMSVPPPIAKVVPHTREVHGDRVIDPYHWMSDKQDPDLLRYLEEENAFTTDATAHLEGLREEIFNDISARTKQTDMSVPIWVTHTNGDSWWYFTRTTAGLEYPRFCRIPGADRDEIPNVEQPQPDEEVLLDLNLEAEGHEFLSLGWAEVSPTGNRLAYSLDTSGDERYDLWIRDLTTRSTLDGPITGVGAGGSWLGEEWIFYNRVDAAWRPFQAWRHRVGVSGDVLVLEEADESFWLGLSGSRDRNWVVIDLSSKTSSEAHLVHVETPRQRPVASPPSTRRRVLARVARDCLYILHNDGAPSSNSPEHHSTPPGLSSGSRCSRTSSNQAAGGRRLQQVAGGPASDGGHDRSHRVSR